VDRPQTGIVLTDADPSRPRVTPTSKCPTCGAGPEARVEQCGFGPERPIMCLVCTTVLEVKRV